MAGWCENRSRVGKGVLCEELLLTDKWILSNNTREQTSVRQAEDAAPGEASLRHPGNGHAGGAHEPAAHLPHHDACTGEAALRKGSDHRGTIVGTKT